MNGGPRYWNEDTQRWEDGTGTAAPVTPPPPPRPEFLPPAPAEQGGATPPDALPGGTPAADARAGVAGPGGWSEVPDGGAWPPAGGTAPAPPGSRGPGRRLVWGVLGGAAAAGVAVALALTFAVGDDGGDGGPGDGKAASATASRTGGTPSGTGGAGPTGGEPTDDASAAPSGPASELPADYELHTDAEGFTIARPQGWTREATASQHGMDVVTYRSADRYRRLQVYEVAESSPEESFELFLSDRTPKAKGFEQVALERLDERGVSGVRLEYRADSFRGEPDVGSWHVQDVRFRSPGDGKLYAIAAYGPPTDGVDPELDLVLTALTHFCPPATTCERPTGGG
ncbi:hypothetical protein [Streptomyces sp. DH24]|uniref:hypothetical protein n=1 Tax=Streptomyces sp. DH24 TaxID=3040123 RepID=UPI0024436FD1|nr:hypothetical protein [Streptomyces sp. DH24]MDG9720929.1 hypothetical protein [Streptomyces sp. DH24]